MRGLGTDIIEISRIQENVERFGNSFLNKIFTPKEVAYCQKFKNPMPHFAGRWAAKESVAKALGCGFGASLSFDDVEILPSSSGAPQVKLSPKAKKLWGPSQFMLSISHCKEYATAVAIWIK
jgi:holo-[acyl-carrier protein] synthase